MNQRIATLLCLCLNAVALNAHALADDSAQLLHIQSNTFNYQDQRLQGIYQGNVIATQGSRYLTADKLVIQLTPDKQISQVDAYGTPAHYHYQPNPGDPLVYASANNIRYNPSQNMLSLIGNGEVQQNGNVFKGSLITYNTQTQIIESNGTKTPGGKPLMIIQPQTQRKAVPSYAS